MLLVRLHRLGAAFLPPIIKGQRHMGTQKSRIRGIFSLSFFRSTNFDPQLQKIILLARRSGIKIRVQPPLIVQFSKYNKILSLFTIFRFAEQARFLYAYRELN